MKSGRSNLLRSMRCVCIHTNCFTSFAMTPNERTYISDRNIWVIVVAQFIGLTNRVILFSNASQDEDLWNGNKG